MLEKLSDIVDQVTNEDQEANVKLMEWFEKKFQAKVNDKIAPSQVELDTKIKKVKKVLEDIFSPYTKLCDPTIFTYWVLKEIWKYLACNYHKF